MPSGAPTSSANRSEAVDGLEERMVVAKSKDTCAERPFRALGYERRELEAITSRFEASGMQ